MLWRNWWLSHSSEQVEAALTTEESYKREIFQGRGIAQEWCYYATNTSFQKGSAEHEAQLQAANASEFVQLPDNPEVSTSNTIAPKAVRTMNCLSYEDIWSRISGWTLVKWGCGWEKSCRKHNTVKFPNSSTFCAGLDKSSFMMMQKVFGSDILFWESKWDRKDTRKCETEHIL